MNEIGTLHFIGIGGIGMSALARIALARGRRVTGSSDRDSSLIEQLRREGATIAIGHRAENLDGAELAIATSALAADNPELVAARAAGVPVISRGELLARLFNERAGIAIAGTHGKTTTTAMTAAILETAGCDPTVAVGGERLDTGTNARCGRGAWFVSEADESDGSFLYLRPRVAVVTNIENDHITSDTELPRLVEQFAAFLAHRSPNDIAIVGVDSVLSAGLATARHGARPAATVTFGLASSARVRAVEPRYEGFGSTFAVDADGERLGTVTLRVPGEINVQNALAALAVGRALEIPFATIAQALAAFRGVRRRFEILARTSRMIVVDDYAHHPTAIAATLRAARRDFDGPIVAAFQPHRYSRTAYLALEFARALRLADLVVLTDVYAASEAPIAGVDRRTIAEPLRALGGDVAEVGAAAELPSYLLAHAPPGALVLMFGAGDITSAAADLARRLVEEPALR